MVPRLPSSWTLIRGAFVLIVCLAFLAFLLFLENYFLLESTTITATLGISMTWRVLAMPVGFGLMLVIALLQTRKYTLSHRGLGRVGARRRVVSDKAVTRR
ncbi:TRAP transporter small permease subunit [Chelatococcus sp. GCM10030263]|uniref:TRAP transporter small permease subunit n=1 Tax=Chelatococcus sp. GCM10030263 TaxID=3273387 RepID=UPI0036127B18